MKFPLLLAVAFLGPKPMPAKVADILKTPAKFDGKTVAITGKVAKFKAKTSKSGRDYYLFDLTDGKDSLHVYGSDKLVKPPKDGDKVTVTGKFAKERTVGDRTFKNEVDASVRLDKAFGVKR